MILHDQITFGCCKFFHSSLIEEEEEFEKTKYSPVPSQNIYASNKCNYHHFKDLNKNNCKLTFKYKKDSIFNKIACYWLTSFFDVFYNIEIVD